MIYQASNALTSHFKALELVYFGYIELLLRKILSLFKKYLLILNFILIYTKFGFKTSVKLRIKSKRGSVFVQPFKFTSEDLNTNLWHRFISFKTIFENKII